MIREILPIISALLALCSPVIYVKAILSGRAKPHRTTRFLILTINLITAASIFAQHNHVAIYLALASVIQGIVIFGLSIKRGMGGREKTDIICLLVAITGIVLWQITNRPLLGLYFATIADFTGVVPTLIKTYKWPHTEIWTFFAIDTVAGALTLLATHPWTFQNALYPAYILLINAVMVVLIVGRTRALQAASQP